jgi:Domain of unknown function (DUF4262)
MELTMTKDDDRFERLYRKMVEDIDRTGRSLIGVFPAKDSTDPVNDAFTYSIGNALVGLPELLVVGMFEGAHWPINELSRRMIERGRKFDDGEIVSLGEGAVPVCVIDAGDEVKDLYTIQATNFYRGARDYQVMQVVIPDKAGLFPWQPGCACPYSHVNVYRKRRMH